MAEQPNVIISQGPGEWNLTNGLNVFSLENTESGSPIRFVLQVYDKTMTTLLADLRQDANVNLRAHVDIQNILQAFTVANYDTLTSSDTFSDSNLEAFEYTVKVGYETTSGSIIITNTGGTYKVLNGRKRFDQELWNWDDYRADYSYVPLAPNLISAPALLLTDWTHSEPKPLTGRPTEYASVLYNRQYTQRVRANESFTLSFINQVKFSVPGPPEYYQIGEMYVESFNGTTQVDSIVVENIVSNGGGPDTFICENLDIEQPYNALTAKCGPADIPGLSVGSITHYYVMFRPYEDYGSGCLPIQPANLPYRFEIDEGECNDFEPIQLSWLNSFGFRDYFTFQKRNTNTLNADRNEYYKLPGSWSETGFSVNNTEAGRTVFNQGIEESWTLRTRYLQDYEHAFLRNLFLSPQVMYNRNGEWLAATITSANYTERTFRTDKMFQYEIELKVSNNIQTARG